MAITAQDAWGGLVGVIEETLKGGGAVKGKNCTISNITKADNTNTVTFQWTLDDGTVKTGTMTIKDGVDGESAYEIAKRLGYTGTEEEWLASLIGATGEKGEKGVGIESVTKQSTSGLTDTYVIMFADGTTTTFDVINGANITKTSQLENDSEFITNATIGLINYYLKDEVYSKAKIDELLRNVGAGLSVKIVPSLPTEEISGTTIYLINSSGTQYNQYMYIGGDWASLGSTSVDLSSYYSKTQIDNMLLGYVNASTLLTQLMAYTKTADLAKVAKSNSYNDLDDLPEIPDVSGVKPYTNELQDSENTAPTSKALYAAVENINEEVEKKANTEALEVLATKEELGDLEGLTTKDKTSVVGAVNEINVNLGDLSQLETTEKSNLVGAINEVAENIETSSQILTPLFSEESGNKVVLYKMGKLRMIPPINIMPTSRPEWTYFDAYQLPEDSYPSSKIWAIMPTIENIAVDVTLSTREEGGKIKIRYRGDATFVWFPTLLWVVD